MYTFFLIPFFLHYLECVLHAFLHFTLSLLKTSSTYLHLEYSDSVAVFPAQGLERRPFKYMWQMILVLIQKTGQTTSPTCIKAPGAEASQQLPGILNREGPKCLWEFKEMFPAKCLLHPFKQNNKNKQGETQTGCIWLSDS